MNQGYAFIYIVFQRGLTSVVVGFFINISFNFTSI